ncbi:MAG: transcriptional regulator [Cycloclasticus sp. symbiont of Poecilosclerida sp. M]|nr:MAG: transcriptional regulator [Cycloclasticus sp. symbiont of Poecilosclerida sp. M]
MNKLHILVIDDEPDIRNLVSDILGDEGYEVSTAENAATARKLRHECRHDLILLDIWMPDVDGVALLKEWVDEGELSCPVVMMSGHGTVETAVEATRLGAYDFLEKPLSIAKLLLTIERALETEKLKQENIDLKQSTAQVQEPLGNSQAINQLLEQARRLGSHDTRVLLTGEPGSGKETLAHYLHEHSQRSDGPFVELNTGVITSQNALEEFFGHEEGDFIHYGLLERANQGTLFIDEIGDMDNEVQLRLLSALESKSFQRVGGNENINADVRIIASTRQDLEESIQDGKFRQDLYYHLNVASLHLPALRERKKDIPLLLDFYLQHYIKRENLPKRKFTIAAQQFLSDYAWLGNIRELKNVVQRVLILGIGDEIGLTEVKTTLGETARSVIDANDLPVFYDLPLKDARAQFEKAYLDYHLDKHKGSVTKLSVAVGMERTHLYRKLHNLGIQFRNKREK